MSAYASAERPVDASREIWKMLDRVCAVDIASRCCPATSLPMGRHCCVVAFWAVGLVLQAQGPGKGLCSVQP
jgi:hypothetical protein